MAATAERRLDLLAAIVGQSPADETVITWQQVESRNSTDDDPAPTQEDLLVRVVAHQRVGFHRASSAEPGEIERALRAALAATTNPEARTNIRLSTGSDRGVDAPLAGFDPGLAGLDRAGARGLLSPFTSEDGRARMDWGHVARVVVSSLESPKWAAATVASVRAANPSRLGGAAMAAARSVEGLDLEGLGRRLELLGSTLRDDDAPEPGCRVILGPEATAQLLGLLAIHAFSIRAYSHGRSILRDLLHEQLLDRKLSVYDDGTDPAGLPFPFDLGGALKRKVVMVESGVARTPSVRASLARELGLEPTPHLWAADDARPEHLFLEAGSDSIEHLLHQAEDGIWISNFRALECPDPRRLRIRAIAGAVRRIRGGRLVATMPRLLWETSLLQALGRVVAVGRDRVRIADPSSPIGSLVAPALLLSDAAGLSRP